MFINLNTIILMVILLQPIFGYPVVEVVEKTTKRNKELDPSRAVRVVVVYSILNEEFGI